MVLKNLPPPPTEDSDYEASVGTYVSEPEYQQPAPVVKYKEALPPELVSSIVLNGDLSKLTPEQKTAYYLYRCNSLGLDPATKPFDILFLGGKQVLYANKSCATQLRDIRKISTSIIEEREWGGLLLFRVRAKYPDGRCHEDEGFASIQNLKGDALGNARLKALTKATRRAILNLCGLGELDETEVETIPGAKKALSPAFEEAKALLDSIQEVQQPAAPTVQAEELVMDADGNFWPKGSEPKVEPQEPDGKW